MRYAATSTAAGRGGSESGASMPMASPWGFRGLGAMPRGGLIILYGDGPIERLFGAYHFIRARRAGEIYVLEGGLEGWRRLGYQLER